MEWFFHGTVGKSEEQAQSQEDSERKPPQPSERNQGAQDTTCLNLLAP